MVEDHNINNNNTTHQRTSRATHVNNDSTYKRDCVSTTTAVKKQKISYDYRRTGDQDGSKMKTGHETTRYRKYNKKKWKKARKQNRIFQKNIVLKDWYDDIAVAKDWHSDDANNNA